MALFARLAAAATAVLLLSGLIVPAATGRALPGAGLACGKSARECCCGPMRMADPGRHCVKASCSVQAPYGPSATLSPQREVPGRSAVLAFGSSRVRFPLAGRVTQTDFAFPSAPPRLPPLPPPRRLSV